MVCAVVDSVGKPGNVENGVLVDLLVVVEVFVEDDERDKGLREQTPPAWRLRPGAPGGGGRSHVPP